MKWTTIEAMPHATTPDGRAVRISKLLEPTVSGSIDKEILRLELMTRDGWREAHQLCHHVRDHSGFDERTRRESLVARLKKYAALVWEGDRGE